MSTEMQHDWVQSGNCFTEKDKGAQRTAEMHQDLKDCVKFVCFSMDVEKRRFIPASLKRLSC